MSEPKKRMKRGRPSKHPDKKIKVRSDSLSSSGLTELEVKPEKSKYHNRMLDNYEEQYQNFLKDGISQQSQHLVHKIVHSPCVPDRVKSQPLLIILNSITAELMMNELEIVVLSIYLEKFVWSDESTSTSMLLLYAGYAVKLYLCEEFNALNAYLANKYSGFMEDFAIWHDRYKPSMSVNPKDLNDKFKEMSKAVCLPGENKIMDYNYYVDQILQITPNILNEKPHIEELTKDPEILSIYSAYKNNVKIVPKDCEEIPLPVLEKLDSVLSGVQEPDSSPAGVITASAAVIRKIETLCDAFLNQSDVKEEE